LTLENPKTIYKKGKKKKIKKKKKKKLPSYLEITEVSHWQWLD
jgi:hypothetical protein